MSSARLAESVLDTDSQSKVHPKSKVYVHIFRLQHCTADMKYLYMQRQALQNDDTKLHLRPIQESWSALITSCMSTTKQRHQLHYVLQQEAANSWNVKNGKIFLRNSTNLLLLTKLKNESKSK